jgi:hypothetical protein
MISCKISIHTEAGDGTDYQADRTNISFVAVNKAATITASTPIIVNEGNHCTSQTLVVTPTITIGTGKITVNVNAASGLTLTYLRCHWTAHDVITGTITPL